MRATWQVRWLVSVAVLVLVFGLPSPTSADSVATSKRPIRVVAEEFIDDLFATLWKKSSRDIRWQNGLFGLGAYRPPGMIDSGGLKAPPIHLSPSVGLGNSLNVDPITGRSFFQ